MLHAFLINPFFLVSEQRARLVTFVKTLLDKATHVPDVQPHPSVLECRTLLPVAKHACPREWPHACPGRIGRCMQPPAVTKYVLRSDNEEVKSNTFQPLSRTGHCTLGPMPGREIRA